MSLTALRTSDKFCACVRRTWLMFAIVSVYILLGAVMFRHVEYDARDELVDDALEAIETERHNVLDVLWAHTLVKEQADWMQMAHQKLDMYETMLSKHMAMGVDTHNDGEDDNPWSWMGSVFFAYTSITTIGYGNIYPVTPLGKILTVFYTLIGIPMCIVYLTYVGKTLTMLLKSVTTKSADTSDNYGYGYEEDDMSDEFDFSLTAAFGILLLLTLLGALVFDLLEDDWDYLDSVYFCIISATTIGFGDMTPDDNVDMALTMAYNIIMLSLCSMCINVMQAAIQPKMENCTESFQGITNSLPNKATFTRWLPNFMKNKEEQVWEEDKEHDE